MIPPINFINENETCSAVSRGEPPLGRPWSLDISVSDEESRVGTGILACLFFLPSAPARAGMPVSAKTREADVPCLMRDDICKQEDIPRCPENLESLSQRPLTRPATSLSHEGGEGVNVYLPLVPKRGRGVSREWDAFPSTEENLKQLHSQRGFSLMEVLVGVAILGIVYATLFGLMSTSLRNISRIREREKMVRSAQMKMNELLLRLQRVDSAQIVSGRFDEKYSWQANIEPVDAGEDASQANSYALAKIRLAVTWPGTGGRNQYALETLKWVPQSEESQP